MIEAGEHADAVDALLVACLGVGPEPRLAERLAGLSDAQWAALADLASWHGVAPILVRRLARLDPRPEVPAEVDRGLRDAQQRTALQNMRRFRELAQIVRALGDLGIDVILLKGAHLATTVYGDPGLRMMKDIDLLVRRTDLEGAQRALLELGYGPADRPDIEEECARHHHLPPFTKAGASAVEVHWTIAPPGGTIAVDPTALWQRAAAVRVAGLPAMALSDEDLLVHLSLHAALQHRFRMRQRHLCDIAVTVQARRDRIDWERLAAIANAANAGRFVYCTLRVAESVLGADVPRAALARLERGPEDEQVVPVVRRYFLGASLDLPPAYRAAREAQGLAGKVRVLLRSIAPAPSRLRAMYGLPPRSRAVYLYYPVRLADLIVRRGRVMLAVARDSDRFRLTLERDEIAKRIDHWVEGAALTPGTRM